MTPSAAVSLIQVENEILILKRVEHELDPWSGHLSLPGGKIESFDSSPLAAAIRETQEECGFDLHDHIELKKLEISSAGGNVNHPIIVQPYYFSLKEKPEINLDLRENSKFYWVNLDYLRKAELHIKKKKSKYYPHIDFNCIDINGTDLWGFTYELVMKTFKISIN